MDNKKIIIIVLLTIILIALCSYIAYTMLTPQTNYTSLTINESGTILEIPDDMKVQSNNTYSNILVLANDNTIIVIFNSQDKNMVDAMNFASIKNPIFGSNFEGNTTIKDPTLAGSNLKGECNIIFTGNDTTHDNIIVVSSETDIVNHIINSIKWGNKTTATTEEPVTQTTPTSQDKTYPFTADDGSIMGYYHVGDTVEYMDNIFQLQSGGSWKVIGETTGSSDRAYSSGYSDAVDDMEYEDDYYWTTTSTEDSTDNAY